MPVHLTFLGGFRAASGGEELQISSRRGRVLLAHLALTPDRQVPRDRLVALLWPDRDPIQGRASLRQELSALRRSLGNGGVSLIAADGDGVAIQTGDGHTADVWRLCGPGTEPAEAFDAFGGAFLDGLDLPGADFERWREDERRILRARAISLGEALADRAAERGDHAALAGIAERLAGIDPLNEAAVEARMRIAAGDGRLPDALRIFADHARALAEELDAPPGTRLQRLRDDLAKGDPPRGVLPSPGTIFRRPSVLLAGFEPLGSAEEDRLLALGLTEEMRSTLCCWRWFPVIGPEAIAGKDGGSDPIRAAAAAGAAYTVSGSLRSIGGKVRITANLVEVSTGRVLWSQHFDGTGADIFTFQEEASRAIVARLEPQLALAEAARLDRSTPADATAWVHLMRARDAERRGGEGYGSKTANSERIEHLSRAIESDPDFVVALADLAHCHWRSAIMGWSGDWDGAVDAALECTSRAIRLDPSLWLARAVHAIVLLFGRHELVPAELHALESVRLNPSATAARHTMGCVLEHLGRAEEALEHLKAVFRLNPRYTNASAVLGDQATCYMLLGRNDEAAAAARRLVAMAPDYSRGLQRAAAALAHAGEAREAHRAAERLRDVMPEFSEDYVMQSYPFDRAADLRMFMDGLRRAGAL